MDRGRDVLTIVLGYDGSDSARRGATHIGRLAAQTKRVLVVAVTPQMPDSSMSAEPLVGHEFDPDRMLAEAAELLADTDGVTVKGRTATGDPARVLVDVGREVQADLLVVGRRGSDFVARTLLGSVAERVVQQASCDVLVVA